MIELHTNISEVIRSIDYEGKAILKEIGDSIAQMVWEEFNTLLIETAQYTGTTTASWNLSMGGDQSVREQPERTAQTALQRGHMDAVDISRAHNFKSLIDISTKYRYSAIVVENNAPGAEASESGITESGNPLRAVNTGAAWAFLRFQQRVANRSFDLVRSRNLYA